MQGHMPSLLVCHYQMASSVHQHRRRVNERLESEVYADFFFCLRPERVRELSDQTRLEFLF